MLFGAVSSTQPADNRAWGLLGRDISRSSCGPEQSVHPKHFLHHPKAVALQGGWESKRLRGHLNFWGIVLRYSWFLHINATFSWQPVGYIIHSALPLQACQEPAGSVFVFQVAPDVWPAKGSWKVKLGFDKGNNLILIILPIFLSIPCCTFSIEIRT